MGTGTIQSGFPSLLLSDELVSLAYSVAGPLSVRQLGEVAQVLGADTAGPSPYLCSYPSGQKASLSLVS